MSTLEEIKKFQARGDGVSLALVLMQNVAEIVNALEGFEHAFLGLEDALTALDAISDSGPLMPDETHRLYSQASEAYSGLHSKRVAQLRTRDQGKTRKCAE